MQVINPLNIYLIGGFLGSGKTTAIANACYQLREDEKQFAVITNDQGDQLVDTSYFKSLSISTAEVFNGCFCCNYNELERQISKLTDFITPQFVFAESVGSCTDLVATIAKPFAVLRPEYKLVISVFADAALLLSIIKGNASFINEQVQYIYKKQLEEADILILNKRDLLEEDDRNELKAFTAENFKGKTIIFQDSNNKNDIINWLKQLQDFPARTIRASLNIDYDNYGAGEAALAWLDKKISLHTINPVAVDAARILTDNIYNKIKTNGYAVGHLKFFVNDHSGWFKKISYTGSDHGHYFNTEKRQCKHLDILINARVETTPAALAELVSNAIHETIMETGCRIVTEKEHAFTPGYPKPTHRFN